MTQEKKIKLIEIDIDKNPELAQKLNIQGLPTLYYYYKGILKWNQPGFISEADLSKKL